MEKKKKSLEGILGILEFIFFASEWKGNKFSCHCHVHPGMAPAVSAPLCLASPD